MKFIFINAALLVFMPFINAQSPIIDLEDKDFRNIVQGAYYKDINNYLDPFVGTWIHTDGNTSLKIVITKHEMGDAGIIYEDYLKGEYQYIENGTELVNTLANTEVTTSGFGGSHIIRNNKKPNCNDCTENERRVSLIISDYERELAATFTLKQITVNGEEGLRGFIFGGNPTVYHEDNPPPYFSMNVPDGTYIFMKQED